MEKYQERAWDCLTSNEQNCLYLNFSQGLSARRSGEIMKIAHYKYLELKARAEKFFKLYSDFFAIHNDIFRPDAPVGEKFRDYIYGCILRRLPKLEATEYAGDSAWLLKKKKNKHIIRGMETLKASTNQWDKDTYAFIMEFDRWNNFRILPRILQAPSAYKRRGNKKDKIYLKYLHRIPDSRIRAMVDIYWSNGRPDKRYYIAMLSEIFEDGYGVVPIKRKPEIVSELTKNKIYIFEEQIDADKFGLMVYHYFEKTSNIKLGLAFWKEYRELIETAINYREINNMDFTCENLDMAYNLKRKPIHKLRKNKQLLEETE